ncbi:MULTISPECIES: nitroreductase family protein [unclassified Breznakia]|uniref:nitroreductase family protein n=1 Tax=unclassified Breznakia TaxID=2623764 RepID=UPI002475C0B4|nr:MULTISPECIES: nitroreductase family protein [unclassified Breznakia]MDH6366408.1 nitroreductase [Breznakia sp. PH1-1]MDH6403501.1 nitroreductase [Breznakia sp. PF1-11]MDH6411210.1 nitroreductase [Breznakia sp. PFB1-11]MDH6413527.1 nitroreductase [Breznakia sp. PFB1-14]MDH6415755.1 nitroreductase [Breznakia sp. PFB1-4]
MGLLKTILQRRSTRIYTNENVPQESLESILQAGLLAPTSMNRKPCSFYIIQDTNLLQALSKTKKLGATMLATCNCAIVVVADSKKADTWIEDSSIALSYMSLMATELGIGNCWCQIHLRKSEQEEDAETLVCKLLELPSSSRIVGILALGFAKEKPKAHKVTEIDWNNVHYRK